MTATTKARRAPARVEIPASRRWVFPPVCVRCLKPADTHVGLSVTARHERGTFWGIQVAQFRTGPLPPVPYCQAHRNAMVGPERAANRTLVLAFGIGLLFSLLAGISAWTDATGSGELGDRLGSAIFAAMVAGFVTGLLVVGVGWVVERLRHRREWMGDYARALKGDEAQGSYHPGVEATIMVDGDAPEMSARGLELEFENAEYARRFAEANGLRVS